MGRRRGGIPDRWLNYNPIGEKIAGTSFIAFKVPLKEQLVQGLPEHEQFTTKILLDKQPNIGLIIDLTNTDRYYNSQDILGQGIRYEKIFCQGQEIPNKSVVDRFFTIIDEYLEKLQSNPINADDTDDEKLIGVHCTHGLNRTGYLLCRYMIRRLGFNPEDAIAAFEKARGYRIERDNYISDLHRNEDLSVSVPDTDINEKNLCGSYINQRTSISSQDMQAHRLQAFPPSQLYDANDDFRNSPSRSYGCSRLPVHNSNYDHYPTSNSFPMSRNSRSDRFSSHPTDWREHEFRRSQNLRASVEPYNRNWRDGARGSRVGRDSSSVPGRVHGGDYNSDRFARSYEYRRRSANHPSNDSYFHQDSEQARRRVYNTW